MAVKVRSEHVAVIWVQIAHTLLLLFGDGGTLVRVIPPPVLQHQADKVDDVRKERKADEPNADGVTGCKGTGFGQEGESGNETTEVTEPDLPTGSDGTA